MDAKTPSSGRRKPHEVLVDSRCRFAFGRRLVFISHSSKDNSIAETICNQLESAGIRCWIAPRDIQVGSDWTRGIMQGIARCRVFVLVFTDHANDSEHVGREVANAFSLGLAVIPFRIEAVNPRDNLAYFLETVQWFDAITPPRIVWPGNGDESSPCLRLDQ